MSFIPTREQIEAVTGAASLEKATEGAIRKLVARSMRQNAMHGSDSNENVGLEIAFCFSGRELF